MTPEQARVTVIGGAQFIDGKLNYNWWGQEHLNLFVLDIDSYTDCILGQLFKDNTSSYDGYNYAVNWWWTSDADFNPGALGFLPGTDRQTYEENTALLTEAWLNIIQELRGVERSGENVRRYLAALAPRVEETAA